MQLEPVAHYNNLSAKLREEIEAKLKAFEGKTWKELDEAGMLEDLKAADENKFFDMFEAEYGVKYNQDKR